jgi:hypothetical protein
MLGKKRTNQQVNKSESFLTKLYTILSDTTYDEIIHWDNDGKRVIICDVINLCNIVLPKFYKHRNYSSFVRQLNMYGFHKSKGKLKSGEGYEHEKFNANITNEEILKIQKPNKKMKVLEMHIKEKAKDDSSTENGVIPIDNEDNVLKYLYEKNENNVKFSHELKKEIEALKKENTLLNEEIASFKLALDNQKILLERLLKKSNDTQISTNSTSKNAKDLNQLFNRYLYFLKIYSPYVTIENKNIIKQNDEKKETNNKDLEDGEKDEIDGISLFDKRNAFPFFDLSLAKDNSSRSFSLIYEQI